MLEVHCDDDGTVHLAGRFDAAQVDRANVVFEKVSDSALVDMTQLEYISSAGLGVLLATQKRLHASGKTLVLANINAQIRNVLRISGFDRIFTIK